MKQLRDNKGFTLIELMIVVVIIGILAAIAIPKFTSVSDGAKQAEAAPILKQICSLAEAEMLKANTWPTDLATLPGWEAPSKARFTFAIADAAGVTQATATPDEANGGTGLEAVSMNCDTKQEV